MPVPNSQRSQPDLPKQSLFADHPNLANDAHQSAKHCWVAINAELQFCQAELERHMSEGLAASEAS
eukprot:9219409-Alexandrium_andersonii.AAC.1